MANGVFTTRYEMSDQAVDAFYDGFFPIDSIEKLAKWLSIPAPRVRYLVRTKRMQDPTKFKIDYEQAKQLKVPEKLKRGPKGGPRDKSRLQLIETQILEIKADLEVLRKQ
jgi:hypothetical protein